MRWQFGALEAGGGPDYCQQACQRDFSDPTSKCDECNEPELWPENVEIIALFNSCWSQRRYHPDGYVMGFEWAGVRALMQSLEVDTPTLSRQLKVLESEMASITKQQAQKT